MEVLSRGAEALITEKKAGKRDIIVKQRVKKGYRISEIDEKLRKLRTRSEAKIMTKLHGNIAVPRIFEVSEEKKEIDMEFLDGKRLSDWLDRLDEKETVCREIGKQTAKMHDLDIIHGDLTTSNMILCPGIVYFIDFGLAFHSQRIEDKAVDLHLLRQALEAKHFLYWKNLFEKVLEGYKESRNAEAVLKQLKKVEARGRYKSML